MSVKKKQVLQAGKIWFHFLFILLMQALKYSHQQIQMMEFSSSWRSPVGIKDE